MNWNRLLKVQCNKKNKFHCGFICLQILSTFLVIHLNLAKLLEYFRNVFVNFLNFSVIFDWVLYFKIKRFLHHANSFVYFLLLLLLLLSSDESHLRLHREREIEKTKCFVNVRGNWISRLIIHKQTNKQIVTQQRRKI